MDGHINIFILTVEKHLINLCFEFPIVSHKLANICNVRQRSCKQKECHYFDITKPKNLYMT